MKLRPACRWWFSDSELRAAISMIERADANATQDDDCEEDSKNERNDEDER